MEFKDSIQFRHGTGNLLFYILQKTQYLIHTFLGTMLHKVQGRNTAHTALEKKSSTCKNPNTLHFITMYIGSYKIIYLLPVYPYLSVLYAYTWISVFHLIWTQPRAQVYPLRYQAESPCHGLVAWKHEPVY